MTPDPISRVYQQAGGCDIQLDLYPAQSTMPVPVIVWIHGGALILGTRKWMQPVQRQLLHEAGYAQISIDYRLAPETKLPEIVSDVRAALDWIGEHAAEFNLDAARVGVMGHSGGGYLALMTGCFVEARPKAIVAFYGYGDIIGDWYAKPDPFYLQQPLVSEADARSVLSAAPLTEAAKGDRGKFYLYCRQQGLWPKEVMGVDPAENPEAFTPYCPAKIVTRDFPPTLLLHGTDDRDVPFAQSVQMAASLTVAGVAHELVSVIDGAHSFDGRVKMAHLTNTEDVQGVARLYKVVQWFGKYV